MAKMTAAEAAVRVMEREGVEHAFGIPGAAINPLYAAMKRRGSITHVLARHVEGASHMAEGYTRARAGNIGVCIGTSGPAGTDMITGLYSAQADSIPILCITGQAPRARLYKEDFQAVDIESISKPVTKWSVTVREPAQVPRVFQQSFHLMRSGRPGPVLIDLPFDVQMAEIEFDDETYEPLPVYKPKASRAQIEKALGMLNEAKRPLMVAGGGVINADASSLLVEFAEITGVPVIPTLMGWGAIPDDHPLMVGMVGLQTSHRYGNATMLASDFVLGIGNRWANRHTGSIEVYTKGRKFVEVTNAAGLPHDLWTTSAAWADFDGDGYPDLYVCQYVDWSFDNHPFCDYGKGRDIANGKRPASSRTVVRGWKSAVSASARCCARRILTTCRSSRSACTRRCAKSSTRRHATSPPSGCRRSRQRSSCMCTSRAIGSTAVRRVRWAGRRPQRWACAPPTRNARSSRFQGITTFSS